MAKRAACTLALSLTAGILYGRTKAWWVAGLWLLFLFGIGVGIGRECKGYALRAILLRAVACLMCFYAGAGHADTAQQERSRLEEACAKEGWITVQGRICRVEEKKGSTEEEGTQFIYYLKDTRIFAGGKSYPGNGILIYSYGCYQHGNILQASGTYTPFQVSRNQGNFNEQTYYYSKDIGLRLYASEEALLSEETDAYAILLAKIRQKLKMAYQACMEQGQAGVMANMCLGDRSLLDKEWKTLYHDAGISHILAISGLHVSLFGMGVFHLLQRLRCPRMAGILLSMGIVYSFGRMSGMEVSTVRAVGMFVLSMSARASGYSYDSLTALGLSLGVQVWENPYVLDNAGFLFSYSAVVGVAVAAKQLQGRQKRKKREGLHTETGLFRTSWIQKAADVFTETVAVSGCIQLVTLPLSLYFYYEVSCYSILVNGCVLPFMGALLFLGILGAFVGCFHPALGKLICMPAGWLLSFQEWICEKTLLLPGAVRLTGKPPVWLVMLYYAWLLAMLCVLWQAGKRQRDGAPGVGFVRSKKGLSMAGIAAAVILLLSVREEKGFAIHMLDVGQGDGILIQTPGEGHFFLDGGSSDVKQVGKYRILPFLKAKGIRSIKGWIVSHTDQDHISGLAEVLEEGYRVEHLIVAKGMAQDNASRRLLQLAQKAGCRIQYVAPGMQFGAGGCVFTVLYPKAQVSQVQTDEPKKADRNGASLAITVSYQGFTGLFTGDIGFQQERELIEAGVSPIDFYKAAHHGSDGSNSLELLERLCPKVSAISCGSENAYGHPGKDAVLHMRQVGSVVFCTADCGQITVIPDGTGIMVIPYLPRESEKETVDN